MFSISQRTGAATFGRTSKNMETALDPPAWRKPLRGASGARRISADPSRNRSMGGISTLPRKTYLITFIFFCA